MSAPRSPGTLSAADVVDVLACTQQELERWKRAVLPTGPRKRAGQADDEYRADEVIAVAVGKWLEGLKRREALPLAARLVGNLPDEGSWCVLVTYRTVQLITDPESRAGQAAEGARRRLPSGRPVPRPPSAGCLAAGIHGATALTAVSFGGRSGAREPGAAIEVPGRR